VLSPRLLLDLVRRRIFIATIGAAIHDRTAE
jgi:hypothetical protein